MSTEQSSTFAVPEDDEDVELPRDTAISGPFLGMASWADVPDTLTETVVGQFVLPPLRALSRPATFDEEDQPTSPLWLELSPDEDGVLRLGPYRLLEVLAIQGGLALAHGRRTAIEGPDRDVVLKVPTRPEVPTGHLARWLSDDVTRLSIAHHRNLVPLVDAGRAAERPFLAFEAWQGTNVRRVVEALARRGEALPFSVAAWIVAEACRGLDGQMRLCPPDTEPLNVSDSNILIGMDGRVALAGFALTMGPRGEGLPLKSLATYAAGWLTGGTYALRDPRYEIPETLIDILEAAGRPAARPLVIADALDAWRATEGNAVTPVLLSRFIEVHRLFDGWQRAFGPKAWLDRPPVDASERLGSVVPVQGPSEQTLSALVVAEEDVEPLPEIADDPDEEFDLPDAPLIEVQPVAPSTEYRASYVDGPSGVMSVSGRPGGLGSSGMMGVSGRPGGLGSSGMMGVSGRPGGSGSSGMMSAFRRLGVSGAAVLSGRERRVVVWAAGVALVAAILLGWWLSPSAPPKKPGVHQVIVGGS